MSSHPDEHRPDQQPSSAGEEPQGTAGKDPSHDQQRAVDAAFEGTADFPGGSSPTEALEAELNAARQEALRACAELENYRKRVRREMDDERRYASFSLLRDLLPVVDNLTRALDAAEKSPADAASLTAGVRMVAQELQSVLERHNCKRIVAQGQPFDTSVHAAIGQVPSLEHPAGTVVQVAVDGYQLHDRVIRPAQVLISAPPPPEST